MKAAQNPGKDIVEGILPDAPGEYMMVAGRGGIGKTNLVMYLAFCIATGQLFYGLNVQQSKVGYLAFEGGESQLLGRMQKIAENFPDVGDNLLVERAFPYLLQKGKSGQQFSETIQGLEVIITDPLRYLVNLGQLRDAAPFVSLYKTFLQTAGAVGILIHHVRKKDRRYRVKPEDLMDEVKGATDFVDAASSVLLLERGIQSRGEKQKYQSIPPDDRVLYFVKAKDAPSELEPWDLTFNRQRLVFEMKEEDLESNT